MSLFLCLDQGGHASRVLVLDRHGEVLARAEREVATATPAPDCVEQDPDELIDSLRQALREVAVQLGPAPLHAAGLATQRSSIVCWDNRTGKALSPVLSWQDRRAAAGLEPLTPFAGDIAARTGLRLSAHYGASKLRWCLDNINAVARAARAGRLAFGPLASFVLFRLLEEHPLLVDPANAQRTLLWNLRTRDWDSMLLEHFGLPRAALPGCVPTRHVFGRLIVGDREVPLTVATGDQPAALFALGRPASDLAYVNIGTGAFVQRIQPEMQTLAGLLSGIAAHDGEETIYTLEGTVNGAGTALDWARQAFGLDRIDDAACAEWLARSDEPPLFLNGIGGLGAPYWRADFRSRMLGEGEPWQQWVAVAESVVFLIMANLERMHAAGGLRALIASGGVSRFDGLCQRLADLATIPVCRPAEHEATARGLGWLLAARPAQWSLPPETVFTPVANAALAERYRRWSRAMAEELF